MSDGTTVSNCVNANYRWILHGNGEESKKDPFDGSSFLMEMFKNLATIVDLFPDARG